MILRFLLLSLTIFGWSQAFPLSASSQPQRRPAVLPADDDEAEQDPIAVLVHHTETCLIHRGTPKALDSLAKLAELCQQRIPYQFETSSSTTNDDDDDSSRIICHLPNLIPPDLVQEFLQQLAHMESQGWWSQNPDSVDGLPSLHLNLISGGKPMISDQKRKHNNLDDFEQGIDTLTNLIKGPIYDTLLPQVHALLGDDSIEVSDVFVRRYGQDVVEGATRQGISAHYDVFSRATSVIALDDTAAQGTNGLYTTYIHDKTNKNHRSTAAVSFPFGQTSNHASLRRFFPLAKGDGVVHTFDVLHGVDVESGIDRSSLIIWFVSSSRASPNDNSGQNGDQSKEQTPWWLVERINELEKNQQVDEVVPFVLASALSSMDESEDKKRLTTANDETLSDTSLYLQSAQQGNSFALTRMGSLCEEQALSEDELKQTSRVLDDSLRAVHELPLPIVDSGSKEEESLSKQLAKRFWYEGAIRGNPLAQHALADELMMEASVNGNEELRILAATLFALAAQQGSQQSIDALSRVVQYDLEARQVQSEEEFLASPIVQIARAALVQEE
jgi:hypothetical protein